MTNSCLLVANARGGLRLVREGEADLVLAHLLASTFLLQTEKVLAGCSKQPACCHLALPICCVSCSLHLQKYSLPALLTEQNCSDATAALALRQLPAMQHHHEYIAHQPTLVFIHCI